MSNQSVQTTSTSSDKIKVALAIFAAFAGVVGFYYLAGQPGLTRTLVLVGGLALAVLILYTSTSGREFLSFAKEAVRETRKVVWPSRKEATQITGIVFAFVFVMALFLWLTDKTIAYFLYDLILRK
ncbi:preprotein translocase subunit SecE [Massilia glaciei]|uniref:Protein translocase subunit SecE n=1 Tax=Massilia glaciei TaxID=1524097 RepID=A0A2U2I5V0_9BURK|nr:preprotein translocase subunit SecE [Massilia glaciei]PWF55138.1 preprotein translocase subunit SecE [Massilia glaciei]